MNISIHFSKPNIIAACILFAGLAVSILKMIGGQP
jgi:hypothetical protein